MWPFPFVDPVYLLFALPALLLALYAQFTVHHTYGKYATLGSVWGATGYVAARRLLDAAGLNAVDVERVPGDLTDHYDPSAKVLRLSASTYASPSVAALGVVAHEVGHAVQDAVAYAPLRLRQGLVPVAGFGSSLGSILFLAGLVMQATALAVLGLALFSAAALFALVTLPVELNASRRALGLLQDTGLLASGEVPLVKEVLDAAALTYVAGLAQALSQLFYFLHLLLTPRADREA
jgi:Zn-dependent membrane protease YugP